MAPELRTEHREWLRKWIAEYHEAAVAFAKRFLAGEELTHDEAMDGARAFEKWRKYRLDLALLDEAETTLETTATLLPFRRRGLQLVDDEGPRLPPAG